MKIFWIAGLFAMMLAVLGGAMIGQEKTTGSSVFYDPLPKKVSQISQYIRRMFQDRNGNIWFGTNGDGLARYDPRLSNSVSTGKPLEYFTMKEGFSGRAVRGIVEDRNGNLWFATDAGVSRYDGKTCAPR